MRGLKKTAALAVAATMIVTLGACSSNSGSTSSSSDSSAGTTLMIWNYETDNSAMGQGWARAVEIFKERHPEVTVKVEKQTFEQLQKNAKIILTGDDVPDVMEYNKGNSTSGQLASQGLLTDMSDTVKAKGWDKIVKGSTAVTAQYSEDGLMGSGSWYGIPNYGEYVTVFYNKKMFDEAGVKVPTTMAELESVMDTFVSRGQTPLAEAGSEYPLGQLWYLLSLEQGDTQFVKDYQTFAGDVDWTNGPTAKGAKTLKEWVDKGYIDKNSSGLTAEDMGTAFISGKYPMMVSGSWWFGRLQDQMQDEWGQFLFPSKLTLGSSGNLWVVPEKAKNKELAYEFIDITLSDEVQKIIGEKGGLPVAGDTASISDEQTRVFTENFHKLADSDSLAFYPDWPVPGFYDQVVSTGQSIMSGSKTPEAAMTDLGKIYNEGKKELLGK